MHEMRTRSRMLPPACFDAHFRESGPFAQEVLDTFIPAYYKTTFDDFRLAVLAKGSLRSIEQDLFVASVQLLAIELRLASLAGLLPGDSTSDRYAAFVSAMTHGWFLAYVDDKYPVLRQIAAALLDNAEANESRCRLLLEVDATDLARLPGTDPLIGEVVNLSPLGDTHEGGLRTTRVHFGTGESVILKHHSAVGDEVVEALVAAAGLQASGIVVPPRVSRPTHHWQKWIVPGINRDEGALAAALGAWLALSHFSATVDLHGENLLQSESLVYGVDLECVAHGLLLFRKDQMNAVWGALESTSILPMRVGATETFDGFNWGAFGGISDASLGGSFLYVLTDQTDQLSIEYRSESSFEQDGHKHEGHEHGPSSEAIVGRHAGRLAEAFVSTSRKIRSKSEGWITTLRSASLRSRHVLRPTQAYGDALMKASHPAGLIDPDRHAKILADGLRKSGPDELDALVPFETESLVRRQIPLFLEAGGGDHIQGWPELSLISGVSIAAQRIRQESDEQSLNTLSKLILKSSASFAGPMNWNSDARHAVHTKSRTTAQWIADRIVADTMPGEMGWVNVSKSLGGGWRANRNQRSLYSGSQGIIMAMAIAETSGLVEIEPAWRSRALQSLHASVEDCVERPGQIGAFEGIAGLEYTIASLVRAGWIEPDAAREQIAKLATLVKGQIPSDTAFDVLSGSAGALLVHPELVSAGLLEVSIGRAVCDAALEHLAESAIETGAGLGWAWNAAGEWLGGFSHGVAGYAVAAARSVRLTSHTQLAERLARGAWESQLSLLDSENFTWRDLRPEYLSGDGAFSAWCHGGYGIALAWEELSTILPTDQRMQVAHLEHLTAHDQVAALSESCLCHGSVGNLAIAATLRPDAVDSAQWDSILTMLPNPSQGQDEFEWMDLSLMCGKAGPLWASAWRGDTSLPNPLRLSLV